MKRKVIKEQIRKDLKLDEQEPVVLNEAYSAQPKKYNLNTEALRSKTKQQHLEIYENYIETLNQVSADLDTVDRSDVNDKYSGFRDAKKAETWNQNSVYCHELYFANISDVYSEIHVDSLAYMRLNRDFGTFDDWQRDFLSCSLASRGWAICGLNIYLRRYVNIIVDGNDEGLPVGFIPVICLDLHTHARRDYLNQKRAYVEAMMQEFRWLVIEERFKRADAVLEIIK